MRADTVVGVFCAGVIFGLLAGWGMASAERARALEQQWESRCNPRESERLNYSIQRVGFGLTCVYVRVKGMAARQEKMR